MLTGEEREAAGRAVYATSNTRPGRVLWEHLSSIAQAAWCRDGEAAALAVLALREREGSAS